VDVEVDEVSAGWAWRHEWGGPPQQAVGQQRAGRSAAVGQARRTALVARLDGPAGGRAPAYATTPVILAGRTDSPPHPRRV